MSLFFFLVPSLSFGANGMKYAVWKVNNHLSIVDLSIVLRVAGRFNSISIWETIAKRFKFSHLPCFLFAFDRNWRKHTCSHHKRALFVWRWRTVEVSCNNKSSLIWWSCGLACYDACNMNKSSHFFYSSALLEHRRNSPPESQPEWWFIRNRVKTKFCNKHRSRRW